MLSVRKIDCQFLQMTTPNQQSSVVDETLASNATRLIFKAVENNKCQNETTNEEMDNERLSVTHSYIGTDDMVRNLMYY